MMRLHRSALFAGLLALGVAACGDDVQIVEAPPTPPPALNATLSPSSASVVVLGTADYGVGVSGGETGVNATWTCTSGNTAVATVVVTATGCRATGVAAGSTSINVLVTKGEQTANASSGITVTAVSTTPANLTIGAVTQVIGGVVVTAPINAVQGQLDVTLNLIRNTDTPTSVDVLLGGTVVASQTLANQAPAEVDGEQVVQNITLSFNTAAYNTSTGAVTHLNGARALTARVTVQGGTVRSAANTITLTLTNPDVIHIASLVLPTNSAVSATGQRWYGGPGSGSVSFTAIPVMYSGRTAANIGLVGPFAPGGGCALPAVDTSAPFTFASTCATATALQGVNPVAGGFTAQATDGGPIAFGAAVGAGFAVAAVVPGTNPFPISVDNVAPAGAALVIATQGGGVINRENWVGGSYPYGTGYTSPVDAGVGRAAGALGGVTFQVRAGSAGAAIIEAAGTATTAAGLANSVNNTSYFLQAIAVDLLGNSVTTNTTVAGGAAITNAAAASHTLTTFGKDSDAPTISRGAVGGGAITAASATVNAGGGNFEVQGVDVISGFAAPTGTGGPGEGLRHSLVSVLGTANSAVLTTAHVALPSGTSTGAISATPFATAASGFAAATPNNYVNGYVQTPTSISTNASGTGSVVVPGVAAYYIYQAQVRDKAGNLSGILTWTVYNSQGSVPQITGLVAGGVFTGGTAANFPGVAQDAVEVAQASFDLTYGTGVLGNAAGDRLVYERPNPTVSALFDDAIALPVSFSLVANGFIRGLQGVDAVVPYAPVAGPSIVNTITARAYNGMAASLTLAAVSHADAFAFANPGAEADVSTGSSNYVAAGVLSTQIQAGTAFVGGGATGINDFQIESYGAVTSGANRIITVRVRVTGASGTFVNPFPGGLLLFQRRAGGNANTAATVAGDAFLRPVTATLTPLFTSPFPTADNGIVRDYVWTFTITIPTAGIPPFLNLHAVGLSSGFDAIGTRETQIGTAVTAAGTLPGTVF